MKTPFAETFHRNGTILGLLSIFHVYLLLASAAVAFSKIITQHFNDFNINIYCNTLP